MRQRRRDSRTNIQVIRGRATIPGRVIQPLFSRSYGGMQRWRASKGELVFNTQQPFVPERDACVTLLVQAMQNFFSEKAGKAKKNEL